MKRTACAVAFLIGLIAAFSVAYIQALVCDGKNACGFDTDLCCNDAVLGNTCFNPTTHHCTGLKGTAQLRLCAISDLACNDGVAGKTCYDPSKYDCACIDGFETSFRRLCPKGYGACGASYTCFDPENYKCCEGSICSKFSSDCTC